MDRPVDNDSTRIIIEAMIVVGGVITTWLTLKYQQKRRKRNMPDRLGTIYDGYEKLILQQQHEIERKTDVVGRLEKAVDVLETELNDTKSLLQETKDELFEARRQNIEFKKELAIMRRNG